MRNTGPTKRDIILLVPRHGASSAPSASVLKAAKRLAKKKGKQLLTPSVAAAKRAEVEEGMVSGVLPSGLLMVRIGWNGF